ncbi:chorismate synthase [Ruminiclostridium cellobioparum]|uniref:Chorismate synthase n=1 Tax=Ruminiclostridium cellobioparum subsp. termitidis CT1112 TaxID=1195236 RepID=S0FIS0_RUMCE|nr:chorismate synthase [Ruminiclostridium cellobioparum]EMS71597.1 chorismate synthase [Ruminiclostridium cellobioparum subsp. termitidis CT1112]
MVGNSFGRVFRVTTSGESYSGAFRKSENVPPELWGGLVVIVDGVPAGIKITSEIIQEELEKRRPGQSKLQTPRTEADKVYIFSGVMQDDTTTGAPVAMLIPSSDIGDRHIEQHRGNRDLLRPGQAAYTYFKKYGEHADYLGAGRASARETAARVAGGAVAKQVLDRMGIDVMAYTVESHGIKAGPFTYEQVKQNYRTNEINCPDPEAAKLMTEDLLQVIREGDSCGGVIEIIAKGVPAGLGEPVFDKLSATIAHGLMSIGGVKGVEIGEGFGVASKKGSEMNDTPYYDKETGRIRFKTNRAGGMLGGISNGEEIRIRVAVKPTPTILQDQLTVNVRTLEPVTHKFASRSDPSLVPRVYSICEAMVRIALVDSIIMSSGMRSITEMDSRWDGL